MGMEGAKRYIEVNGRKYAIYSLPYLEEQGIAKIGRLPFTIRVLVENALRNMDGRIVKEEDVKEIANWKQKYDKPREIAYYPARVVMQDFTGVPGVVDLAAMRDAMAALGGSPQKINPLIPVDLIIDHSVQIDHYGEPDALHKNMEKEYERNRERYVFLKWAQKAFQNMRIFPPGSGIIHQINLEYLARVVMTREVKGETVAFPDTLIGTDSHTTMINGIGVLGWGVGGIEAEATMLGQPYYMAIPQVVGVRLYGELPEGVTPTDLVLTITQLLRKHKVVGKFVEYFGPGVKSMSLPDRAVLANMAPEYGATTGFFPVDEETVRFLRLTGREDAADLVERYAKEQRLYYTGEEEPEYSEVVELDMSTVEPSLAGPSRPQDRIPMKEMKKAFVEFLGTRQDGSDKRSARISINGKEVEIADGAVVIAAITSCTNTSNPYVVVGAGLVAKKAVEKGLEIPAYVKTSLAPGSRVVEAYLKKAGLLEYLERLGFNIAGYGCTTCIGNSGPIAPEIEKAVKEKGLYVTSVLSGNRNFEARIHPLIRGNYLASPMLVVAYALAGRIDLDLTSEPIGKDQHGNDVYLKDIWPSREEIQKILDGLLSPDMFTEKYGKVLEGDERWQALEAPTGETYHWDPASTYIQRPPFFEGLSLEVPSPQDVENARSLLVLGDTVTTDHISPAGPIPSDYPAGRYLIEKGVRPEEFNTYGSRRGNHEVMMRGTFANVRIKNRLVAPKEGGFTIKFPEKQEMFVYEAAMKYLEEGVPLIVLAGKEYGTGSSRDWAAKGTRLLGIRAVLAQSFERIHRSNLVGLGVLPLQFQEGEGWESLGLDGSEEFYIYGIKDIAPQKTLQVKAVRENGSAIEFSVLTRLDTEVEVEYFIHGGILQYVLRRLAAEK